MIEAESIEEWKEKFIVRIFKEKNTVRLQNLKPVGFRDSRMIFCYLRVELDGCAL